MIDVVHTGRTSAAHATRRTRRTRRSAVQRHRRSGR